MSKEKIDIEIEEELVDEGWVGSPKGLKQVLWERGWIDPSHYSSYTKKTLQGLLEKCQDFIEEPSAMEILFRKLSTHNQCNIYLMSSPKYHCEIAGEGIEFVWGLTKKRFRNIPLHDKNCKEKFQDCVKACINHISIDNVRNFSGKCRRYMLAYENISKDSLGYDSIEKFVKKVKTHRDMADLDKGYIEKVWNKSIIELT